VGPMSVRTFQGKNLGDRVVGGLRMEGDQHRLVPDIQITTASGIVTVPVAALVPFRDRRP
jgi:hypothetical protein